MVALSVAALALSCCKSSQAVPVWPADLMQDVQSFTVVRWRGDEAKRSVRVVRAPSGVWRTEAPRRGEADPDAVAGLHFTLANPAIISAKAIGAANAGGRLSFVIELARSGGATRRIEVMRAALGAPVPVRILGVGEFTISPVEFSNGIADPSEFMSSGLWVKQPRAGATIAVTGRSNYRLKALSAEEWVSEDGRKSAHELDDVAGSITGRQVVSSPEPGPLSAFGLDAPAAIATMCIEGECREFKFGSVERAGKVTYYAVGPDQDPVELNDVAWKLVVDGPFEQPAKQ
jgi:hypothetical protein